MAVLLKIDSSPLGSEASFSRQLTAEFAQRWQDGHPAGAVISRDLMATELPPVTAEFIGAIHAAPENLTARQREVLATSSELIAELEAAGEYVIGVPMHNFTIPGVLKLWIDQIVRPGRTFRYENSAVAGMLGGKKATFLVASGGVYEPDTPRAGMNFIEPYLRAVFAFVGVTDVSFIYASGTSGLMHGVDRNLILKPALEAIQTRFQAVPPGHRQSASAAL
jgi:FMN-dependent NADH-azoreductase